MKSLMFIISTTLYTCDVIAFSIRNELVKDLSNDKKLENAIAESFHNAVDNNGYWLFTRKNPTIPQIIENGNPISLWTSNYDGSKPIKVIAHGWTRNGTHRVNTELTAAFLEVEDVNVIVLDWGASASGGYFTVSLRVPAVGRFLGKFLQWLINTGGGNWNTVHLVGFSLGAHLMGNAGREVGGRPRRITGLDPAGPFWSNSFALNKDAGQYVEVIHTNILVVGATQPIGHVDFYPNGGQTQPGCATNACSHTRSFEYFASSIRTNNFVGRQCIHLWQAILNQCNGPAFNMGNGDLNKTGNGIYTVDTGSVWPF